MILVGTGLSTDEWGRQGAARAHRVVQPQLVNSSLVSETVHQNKKVSITIARDAFKIIG